jgi:hypothetical protein
LPKKLVRLYISFFLFATLSGVLRKWILQSTATGNIVFGILLLFPLIFFIVANTDSKKVFSNRAFTAFFLLLVIEALNPLNLTIYHGLLGILIHSYLWFLLFLYFENRDQFDFTGFVYTFLIVLIGEVILGFIQYQLPQDHFLNRYADIEKVGGVYATVGSAVRITGTFSYIGGFSAFVIFYIFFVWYLFKINFTPIVTIACLAGGIVTSFMTGSRGITYLYFIILGFFFLIEFKDFKKLKLTNLLPALLLLALMYTLNGNFGSFQKKIELAYQNFDDRRAELANQGEENGRITGDLLEVWNFRGKYPFFGVGLGATYQGATSLFNTSEYVQEYGYYEGESARVILEGGFLLFFARIALCIYVISLIKAPKLLKFLFFLLIVYLVNYTFNIYNAIYLAFGIILIDNVYYLKSKENSPISSLTDS